MVQHKQVATAQTINVVNEGKKIVKMLELGAKLPVGIPSGNGNSMSRDIAFKDWTTREERALGKLKKPNMNMSQYTATVLAHMATRLGPYDWSGDNVKMPEKLLRIGQMYMGDVLYAYCWLRHESMGKDIGLSAKCLMCGQPLSINGDLETLDVVIADDVDALKWSYKLTRPIQVRNKTVNSFVLSAPRWSILSNGGIESNQSIAKLFAVSGSIVGINDDPDPVMLADSELDDLRKIDLERMADGTNEKFVGPKMAIETNCTGCGVDIKAPIRWDYDSFFSVSSR